MNSNPDVDDATDFPLLDLDTEPRRVPLRFTGKGGEYFRIWIVNVFLTILTLGIYSAWAKVRRNRYFYGSADLDGHSFEYLADPKKILKGRILFLLILLPLIVLGNLVERNPSLGGPYLAVLALYAILVPWIVIRGRAFNLRNTAFRNIRFNFKAGYGRAFVTYVALPLAIPFSFGLIFPYFVKAKNHFTLNNSWFGDIAFLITTSAGRFYRRLIQLVLLAIFGILLIPFLLAFIPALAANGGPEARAIAGNVAALGIFVVAPLLFLYIRAYWTASWGELVLNDLRLGEHRFSCTYATWPLMKLYLVNGLAVIFSLGLAIPWTQVRTARYMWENVALTLAGSLDDVLGVATKDIGAFGEEALDGWDLDVGIGG